MLASGLGLQELFMEHMYVYVYAVEEIFKCSRYIILVHTVDTQQAETPFFEECVT
jgi:hypothetical protein